MDGMTKDECRLHPPQLLARHAANLGASMAPILLSLGKASSGCSDLPSDAMHDSVRLAQDITIWIQEEGTQLEALSVVGRCLAEVWCYGFCIITC